MIADQSAIRNKIDELKLSHNGYSRQLARGDLSEERRERLQAEVELLSDEIATLEKLAQVGRVEPDRAVVERIARDRRDVVRERLAADPAWQQLGDDERDMATGEARALSWALGEDALTRNLREFLDANEHRDPSRTDRALPGILVGALENSTSPETRANAAYDLGRLRVREAIPALAKALNDQAIVAEVAVRSLALFGDDELREAGLGEAVLVRVEAARNTSD